jgi:hypothetical protein
MVSYTPAFQHTDWPAGPVNADLPPDNNANQVMHRIEQEFSAVATAFGRAAEVGMVVVTNISHGSTIPVPTGFSRAETKFFAFVKMYAMGNSPNGFQVFASETGVVTCQALGQSGGLVATGVAIARKGGW